MFEVEIRKQRVGHFDYKWPTWLINWIADVYRQADLPVIPRTMSEQWSVFVKNYRTFHPTIRFLHTDNVCWIWFESEADYTFLLLKYGG